MTRPATPTHIEYLADGGTPSFVYPFKIDFANELEVRDNGSLQVESIDYTISGIGVPSGGSVTFMSNPIVGHIISIRLTVPFEQLLDLLPNGAFPAEAIEFRFDQIVKMIQELGEEIGRRPQLAVGSRVGLRDLIIPPPGHNKLFGWGPGDEIILYDTTIQTITVDPVSGIIYGKASALLTPVGGESIMTATGLAPVAVKVTSVTYRCLTDFGVSNGLSSVSIGSAGIGNRWGTTVDITAGITTTPADWGLTGDVVTQEPMDVVVTANGGAFDFIGSCIVTAHWETYIPDLTI